MKYGVFSQNVWVFPDTDPAEGKKTASLCLLKGQTGGLQVVIGGLEAGASINFSVRGADDLAVFAYREMEVGVNRNTNGLQCGALTTDDWDSVSRDRVRKAPYVTYDPLQPLTDLTVEKEQEAYYISICPTEQADAGERTVEITFAFGESVVSIPITLFVGNKSLPASTLKLTNWYSISNMAIAHDIEKNSPEHEAMAKQYFDLLNDCHNNVFWTEINGYLKAEMRDGEYVFDFTEVKRWAEFILANTKEGAILEWVPFVGKASWRSIPFQINNLVKEKRQDCIYNKDGRKYLTSFLRQFNDFLTENGWRDISIVHMCDEPTEMNADDFRILAGIFRKYLPGIKLIDAIEIFFLEESLDIYVPKNSYYQLNKNDFEALRDDRNELWFYTCNMPGGKFLNRFLDSPLLNTRLLHWGNYRYDLTGYLHWGFNRTKGGEFVFEKTSHNASLPAGDANIVYPGQGMPLRSMRFQQMKCGVEEYEILRALSLQDKKKADTICKSALWTFDEYIKDVDEFDGISRELVLAYDNI